MLKKCNKDIKNVLLKFILPSSFFDFCEGVYMLNSKLQLVKIIPLTISNTKHKWADEVMNKELNKNIKLKEKKIRLIY